MTTEPAEESPLISDTIPINQVTLGDCHDVLSKWPDEFVDLIYLDPPFLTQRRHKSRNRDRSKTFAFDDVWESHHEYAEFIFDRLVQCHRVLKTTGSLYFHCDRNASHIARIVLDEVFGADHFRSEIIWSYRRWSNSKNGLLPAHQNILYYTKSDEFTFNQQFTDYSPSTNVDQILQQRGRDAHGKSSYRRQEDGSVISNGAKKGVPLGDVWDIPFLNPKASERVGYPTQKPILLLERILKLSSNTGDLVLDPFCGSGTTLVTAALTGRSYLGIDLSQAAFDLTRSRLQMPVKTESALMETGRDSYLNADPQILQLLSGCDVVPVQRNQGIDALLNIPHLNSIAIVRIQRSHETLQDACSALLRASKDKNSALKILIKTNRLTTDSQRGPQSGSLAESPMKQVLIVESTGLQLSQTIAGLKAND